MPAELSIEQHGLQAIARALKKREDGKELRRDLARNLRAAADPVITDIKSSLMSMPTKGIDPLGAPLRPAVAKNIKAQARLTGKATGVRIRARKTPNIRGFANAPKRLNQKRPFRHPVYGNREKWVPQLGKPRYFDDPINERRDEFRRAVLDVMEDTARKIVREAE